MVAKFDHTVMTLKNRGIGLISGPKRQRWIRGSKISECLPIALPRFSNIHQMARVYAALSRSSMHISCSRHLEPTVGVTVTDHTSVPGSKNTLHRCFETYTGWVYVNASSTSSPVATLVYRWLYGTARHRRNLQAICNSLSRGWPRIQTASSFFDVSDESHTV